MYYTSIEACSIPKSSGSKSDTDCSTWHEGKTYNVEVAHIVESIIAIPAIKIGKDLRGKELDTIIQRLCNPFLIPKDFRNRGGLTLDFRFQHRKFPGYFQARPHHLLLCHCILRHKHGCCLQADSVGALKVATSTACIQCTSLEKLQAL